MKIFSTLMIAIIFSYAACNETNSTSSNSKCKNAVKATIIDMTGLDGCGLMIQLEDEKRLEPTNFKTFENEVSKEAGTKVWLTYQVADGFASICMAGQLVEITCIEIRE